MITIGSRAATILDTPNRSTSEVLLGGVTAAGGVRMFSAGLTPTVPKGIIYERTDPNTGEKYIGQAKSDQRFLERQAEENADLGVKHEFRIIDRANPNIQI